LNASDDLNLRRNGDVQVDVALDEQRANRDEHGLDPKKWQVTNNSHRFGEAARSLSALPTSIHWHDIQTLSMEHCAAFGLSTAGGLDLPQILSLVFSLASIPMEVCVSRDPY
jgi:hypothetical protein